MGTNDPPGRLTGTSARAENLGAPAGAYQLGTRLARRSRRPRFVVPEPEQDVRSFLRSVPALLLVLAAPPAWGAQDTLRVASDEEEVFRQAPDGRPLASVLADTRLLAGERQGEWTEVTLEGWIWAASVGPSGRPGFDLVVTSPGGENLREEPRGRVAARLLRGFLLERVEDGGPWVRVRRTGWMRAPVLEEASAGSVADAAGGDGDSADGGTGAESPADTGAAPTPSTVAAVGDPVVVRGDRVALRTAPEGDTLAAVRGRATVQVVERRGPWARVRLEGWARASELVPPHPDSVADLDVATLRANPDRYAGRRVHWTVRFISLEEAEPERTDFYEGERFILARAPDPAEGFVYLAVPPTLLDQVRDLEPLRPLEVLATVRTGRSALMGVPVLDLQAIF